jgi:hypothetical protein
MEDKISRPCIMCRKEEKHRRYRGISLCVVAKVLSPGRPPGICGVQECAGKDFFCTHFGFHLSVSCYQCSMFIYISVISAV